jgi:hypothetical protein
MRTIAQQEKDQEDFVFFMASRSRDDNKKKNYTKNMMMTHVSSSSWL